MRFKYKLLKAELLLKATREKKTDGFQEMTRQKPTSELRPLKTEKNGVIFRITVNIEGFFNPNKLIFNHQGKINMPSFNRTTRVTPL